MIPWRWLTCAGIVLVATLLPFASTRLAGPPGERCARDGVALGRLLQVRIEAAAGTEHRFCSVRCAEDWLRRSGETATAIRVIDEASGREIDADRAHWVRSQILTSRESNESLHAFARAADARAHAEAYRGQVLSEEERPLRRRPRAATTSSNGYPAFAR